MNRNIILNLAMSIDGYIADMDGGYDWIQPAGDSRLNTQAVWSHKQFLEHVSTVVMGKACYDAGMHRDYTDKQVYVATTQKLEDHDHIHFLSGDLCRQVRDLKETADGDIYLFGGGKVVAPLLRAGLVDEYIIGIIPIILGRGIPLFHQDNPATPLMLTHCYVEDGIVVLRYLPRESGDEEDG